MVRPSHINLPLNLHFSPHPDPKFITATGKSSPVHIIRWFGYQNQGLLEVGRRKWTSKAIPFERQRESPCFNLLELRKSHPLHQDRESNLMVVVSSGTIWWRFIIAPQRWASTPTLSIWACIWATFLILDNRFTLRRKQAPVKTFHKAANFTW